MPDLNIGLGRPARVPYRRESNSIMQDVDSSISIDGFGMQCDDIRDPAKWCKLAFNIPTIQASPSTSLRATDTT